MLARLQQFTTVGLVVLAIGWAALALRSGHAAWAAAGAAIILFGYAVVLGLEFVLLRRTHGDDPTPRASAFAMLHAWLGEVTSAPLVFCWRQPFRSRRWPDHLPAEGRRGVLLIHGFVCNRGLWNAWMARLSAAGTPYVAVNLEPVFGSIDDYVPIIEAAVRRLEQATGHAPVAVAHSMGGLALRRWWADQADERLHHAITIATPHHGTWLGRFAMTPNARQMRRRSAWLQALAQREPASRAARFTCFYGHCDNIVFPPRTAVLAGAQVNHLPGVAHVHMVERPEPWLALLERLRA
jgi:triacylglycerol lipase